MRAEGTVTARDRHAGFVLVAVLSVTALLALLLGGATILSRGSVDTAALDAMRMRDEALLRSGIELAGHQLFVLRTGPEALAGQQLRLDAGTVTIHAAAEAGKVDLNGGDAVLLAAAYRAAGLAAMTPEAFAARVGDWRDADAETAPDGAEAAEYAAAGLAYAPPDGPFRAVSDLAWVLGLGPSDVAALAPFVTVHNPAGRIDPFYAATGLLRAIPGVGDAQIALPDQASQRSGTDRLLMLRGAFRGLERQLVPGEALRVFAVRVEARAAHGGALRTVDAVLIAPVLSDRPFQISQWLER